MTAIRAAIRNRPADRARSLAVLASIIGRKRGVNIVFRSGTSASTDGKTIYLPKLSANATEDDAILLEGLLDHECMHCRFTDFDYMMRPRIQTILKKHPLMFPTFNTLEDVWGEREQSKIYPGCFQNIKLSMEVMIDRNLYGGRLKEARSAGDAMHGYVLHGLLARLYSNVRLQQFADIHRTNLIGFIGQKLTDQIWAVATKVDGVTSTEQCVELAHELFNLIEDELKKEPSEPKQKMIMEMLQSKPGTGDMATLLEASMTKNGANDIDGSDVPEIPEIRERLASESDLVKVDVDQGEVDIDLAALARPIAVKLGTRLETLLEARTETETSIGKKGRRIMSRRLVGLSLGNLSIFKTVEEAEGLDTVLDIVIDLSGSMFLGGTPVQQQPHVVAKTVALALGDVLDKFGLPFAITAYGNTIAKVKRFEDSWRARKMFLNLDQLGSTYTASVIESIAKKIAMRPEKRRLVLLVTDGDAHSNTTVIPAMNELQVLGVEFASIFVGSAGKELEKLMVQADYAVQRTENIESLPNAVFTAIKNAI